MKKKLLGIFVCMLLIATALPALGAGSEEKYESALVRNTTTSLSMQPPEIEWNKTYGGSEYDILNFIEETDDEGYIACGVTEESDVFYGWLLKLDSEGNEEWNITNYEINGTIGGWNKETVGLHSVIQTNDGGYLVSGFGETYIEEFGEGPVGLFWKVNDTGTTEWIERYYDIEQLTTSSPIMMVEVPNGYIASGCKVYTDGNDIIDFNGMLMKIGSMGVMEWQNEYSHVNETDIIQSLCPTDDGGYLLTGWTYVGETEYDYRCWMVKTDADGNMEWDKTFGESYAHDWSATRNCFQTSDDGYIMAGITWSYGYYGDGDLFIIKTDADGDMEWFETFGKAEEYDLCWSFDATDDGGYIFCITKNMNGMFSPKSDIWIIKTDSNGNAQWSQIYGEAGAEGGHYIRKTGDDGGYIVVGHTGVNPFYYDDERTDGLIVKIAPDKPMETPTLEVQKPKSGWFYLFDIIGLPRPIIKKTFVLGDLTLEAGADDASGIDKVEFFINGRVIGEATESPYTYKWTEPDNLFWTYTLKIRAYNNYGGTSKEEQIIRRLL